MNSTESWRIGIERFGGTDLKFSGRTWYKIELGNKATRRNYPKRWTSWAKSSRAQFREETPEETTTRRLWQQSSVHFGEKMCKLKPNTKLRFIFLWSRQRHRRSHVSCVFGSFNAQCWARRIEFRYNGYFEKVQKPIKRLTATRDSAKKRVSTSFCSWSRSVRNSAITRWNASGSIAFMSFAQNADIHMGGKRRNSTNGQKWEDNFLYNGQLSTSRCIKTVNQSKFQNIVTIIRSGNDSKWQACMRETDADRSWQAGHGEPWTSKRNEQKDPTQGIPVWLQPFTVNLEDLETHVLAHSSERARWCFKSGDTITEAQCSCLLPQKPNKKDLSCDQKSVVTWQQQSTILTILSEGRESRNNHRYAVVVQVLATQWNPCKTKTSQETDKNLRKVLVTVSQKVVHTYNLLEFGKYCEDLSWNHRTITLHWSKTCGIAEGAVRRAKEVTSAVLLQSESDDKWLDSMECCYYLRDDQDLLTDGKSQNERWFGESF